MPLVVPVPLFGFELRRVSPVSLPHPLPVGTWSIARLIGCADEMVRYTTINRREVTSDFRMDSPNRKQAAFLGCEVWLYLREAGSTNYERPCMTTSRSHAK